MSRIRAIKPEFFRHEGLYEAEVATGLPLRVAFSGLWTVADREGRFRWRPRVIKLDVLPFDNLDFETVLNALVDHGFIVKYRVGDGLFAHIPSFADHQHVNQREAQSDLPTPSMADADTCAHVQAHGEQEGEQEGKGTQTLSAEDADGAPEEAPPTSGQPIAIYPPEFDELWREYQAGVHERNSSKADAYKAWKKLNPTDRDACWEGVISYGQAITEARKTRADTPAKHLSRFINARAWEPYMEAAE